MKREIEDAATSSQASWMLQPDFSKCARRESVSSVNFMVPGSTWSGEARVNVSESKDFKAATATVSIFSCILCCYGVATYKVNEPFAAFARAQHAERRHGWYAARAACSCGHGHRSRVAQQQYIKSNSRISAGRPWKPLRSCFPRFSATSFHFFAHVSRDLCHLSLLFYGFDEMTNSLNRRIPRNFTPSIRIQFDYSGSTGNFRVQIFFNSRKFRNFNFEHHTGSGMRTVSGTRTP